MSTVFCSNTLCCEQTLGEIMSTLSAKNACPTALATGMQIAIVVIKAFVIDRWQTAVTFWTKLISNGVVIYRTTPIVGLSSERRRAVAANWTRKTIHEFLDTVATLFASTDTVSSHRTTLSTDPNQFFGRFSVISVRF